MESPCASTMAFAIARPIPAPCTRWRCPLRCTTLSYPYGHSRQLPPRRILNAEVFIKGKSIAHTAASLVCEKRITHVVFGRLCRPWFSQYLYYWAIQHLLKQSPNVDIHIVTQHS